MNRPPFVVCPSDYPRSLNVVGEHITVLASGAATGGYEIFLQPGPEGSGPPPHHHPWDESFYVTGGEVAFMVDGQEHVAMAGAYRGTRLAGAAAHCDSLVRLSKAAAKEATDAASMHKQLAGVAR